MRLKKIPLTLITFMLLATIPAAYAAQSGSCDDLLRATYTPHPDSKDKDLYEMQITEGYYGESVTTHYYSFNVTKFMPDREKEYALTLHYACSGGSYPGCKAWAPLVSESKQPTIEMAVEGLNQDFSTKAIGHAPYALIFADSGVKFYYQGRYIADSHFKLFTDEKPFLSYFPGTWILTGCDEDPSDSTR